METAFTPVTSAIGGILIGLGSVLFLMTTGRIAGISGVLSRILVPAGEIEGLPVRVLFLAGLILAYPLYGLVAGATESTLVASPAVLALAGLAVGIGAGLGSGCTSGHGVCGIGRLSARSIVATVTFMGAAIVTVFVLRHLV